MKTLKVHDVLEQPLLVTRRSARALEESLRAALGGGGDGSGMDEFAVDFAGIEGLSPSFVDELLRVFESITVPTANAKLSLRVMNPPTRLSLKFEAIARSHGLSVCSLSDGTWLLSTADEIGVSDTR
jgi:hypothetical protein